MTCLRAKRMAMNSVVYMEVEREGGIIIVDELSMMKAATTKGPFSVAARR